jgi:hypothetical protein
MIYPDLEMTLNLQGAVSADPKMISKDYFNNFCLQSCMMWQLGAVGVAIQGQVSHTEASDNCNCQSSSFWSKYYSQYVTDCCKDRTKCSSIGVSTISNQGTLDMGPCIASGVAAGGLVVNEFSAGYANGAYCY